MFFRQKLTYLINKSDKNIVPKITQKYVVNWNHACLLYPLMDCTGTTISQHYYRPSLRDGIFTHIKISKLVRKTGSRKINSVIYLKRKCRSILVTDYC